MYEKRLIEAYITEHGKEPATDEALTAEDLIELDTQPTVYPRPPQMTSIPALLSLFQNEWDSLALEVYNLKKILKTTQQELSVKMYENDAAVRVIARLVKERDEARASLAKIDVGRGAAGASTNGDAMQVDSAPLPAPILEKISSVQERYGGCQYSLACFTDLEIQFIEDETKEASSGRLGYCRRNIKLHYAINFRTLVSRWHIVGCTRFW